MNTPCYSAEIASALKSVEVIWWLLWGILALAAIAVFFGERERSR